jgi:hypothetical protein
VLSEESRHATDIVILPPESGDREAERDEEFASGENLDQQGIPREVSGELEVHCSSSDDDADDAEECAATSRTHKKRRMEIPRWKKTEHVALPLEAIPPPKVGEEHIVKNEFDVFRLFFTDDLIVEIVKQAMLYAHRDQNNPTFSVSVDEMRQFLGLLLVSGYHP